MIRQALPSDEAAITALLLPVFEAGETYAIPRDVSAAEAWAYWNAPNHTVFVYQAEDGAILGTYFLQANQRGGGSHVANCGYMTARAASGKGIARALCTHSLEQARHLGFKAMQFNFVVASNERAVRLWLSFGFREVGRLPGAFLHPELGYVDALVLYRAL